MTQCQSTISFGDDFGDNSTTFHCKLEEGHIGPHQEKGTMPVDECDFYCSLEMGHSDSHGYDRNLSTKSPNCLFSCRLPDGHSGDHSEKEPEKQLIKPYTLTWHESEETRETNPSPQ